MKNTIQKGAITKLAIIVTVVITSITQYTYAVIRILITYLNMPIFSNNIINTMKPNVIIRKQ